MAEPSLVILGAGGHACVVAEAARMSGWEIKGHVAPDAGSDALLGPWLGDDDVLDSLLADNHRCAIGLGFVDRATAQRRASLMDGIDPALLATVVHPDARIAPSATLGAGSFVAALGYVGTGAVLGTGAIVNTGAIVEHHNQIGTNTHIATGASLSGTVTVGKSVLIGAGCVIKQGVRIDDHAIIGAGSTILHDIAESQTYVGNPGRAV